MKPPVIRKRPGEARIFEINLGPRMRDDDTIAAIQGIDVSDEITIDFQTETAAIVRFRASGGMEGQEYPIRVRWTVNSNPVQTLEALVTLHVTR